MNEGDFIYMLQDVLLDAEDEGLDIASMRTYQDSMLLTTDNGLVVQMNTGEEFQVTVVRSK